MRVSGWVLKALRNFDEFVGVEEYYYFRCKKYLCSTDGPFLKRFLCFVNHSTILLGCL